MGNYTETVKEEADEVLGRKWGYEPIIHDPDSPDNMIPNPQSLQDYNQDYINRWLQKEYDSQALADAARAAQEADDNVTNIIL